MAAPAHPAARAFIGTSGWNYPTWRAGFYGDCPARLWLRYYAERFDVVEVTLSGRLPAQVMHYENVPLFPRGYHVARQSGSLEDMAE